MLLLQVCGGQTGRTWLERQREAQEKQKVSVEKTAASLSAASGSVERQAAAVARQRASAKPVSEWEWSPAARAILEVAPVSTGCIPPAVGDFKSLIAKHASLTGLKPELLTAVVRQESGFNPCAVSRAGAIGLMQLMPETAEYMGVADPFDAEENLRGGSRFLKFLMDRYGGDVALALGAYNAGPGRVDKLGRIPDIPETRNYVKSILGSLAPKL
jgi:soluble lytic murein transglycosylase-like protein